MSNQEANQQLDLRGVPCPANTARILVTLATMDTGEILEAWIDLGEPLENVPPALEAANYRVVDKQKMDSYCALRVEA